jgi:hypothetical protein
MKMATSAKYHAEMNMTAMQRKAPNVESDQWKYLNDGRHPGAFITDCNAHAAFTPK